MPQTGGRFRTSALLAVACLLVTLPANSADLDGNEFFESRIRPLLVDHCYDCHGSDGTTAPKAGLRLDTRDGAMAGGESGKPAIVPGRPDQSLLLAAITYEDPDLQMPPKKKLSPSQIADVEKWIAMGAPDPRTNAPAVVVPQVTSTPHWAFIPPERPAVPEVRDSDWPVTDVDRFILAPLEAHGLKPAPRADRRSLIRRATFDLHGLPPTPEEVAAFEADTSPDAWERLVDRLLASPRYGERLGRAWLDVARYADSKGYVYDDREEARYVHSHPYRDWVVRAFNEDMPYDLFLKLQLAADQIVEWSDTPGCADGTATDAVAPEISSESECQQTTSSFRALNQGDLAAMGFLTLGRRFLGVTHDIIDDRIDVMTRGMQGLTVACARCHDHKYDPISTRDYYSLYGVFDSTTERFVSLVPEGPRSPEEDAFLKELQARTEKFESAYREAREEVARRLRERTTDYLVAQLTAKDLPSEEFYEILDANQVNPIFVRRWQACLREVTREFHPIFTPWRVFAALPEENFREQAPSAWADLKAQSGSRLNALVREAFDANVPQSLKEVAETYGRLFAMVNKDPATTGEEAEATRAADARAALKAVLEAPNAPVYPPEGSLADTQFYFDEGARVRLGQLWRAIEEWHVTAEGAIPHAGILVDREPRVARVFRRGNPGNPGEEVPRQYLEVVCGPDRKPFRNGSGRLEMANLIASRSNPLTARVMVNRVWLHHFGAGLVSTPSDFGTRCEPPTHPELLDYLATWFMDNGWSLKKLHRLIMTSATYQQSSLETPDSHALEADPGNRLLGRMNRRRLDFESLRDSLLAASGELDLSMGGRPVDLFARRANPRRTIYGLIDRRVLPGTLRAFDFANPDLHVPQRHQTTVPQQALYLMNATFVVERAHAMVERAAASCAEERVQRLYQIAYQREPGAEEIRQALEFIELAAQEVTEPPAPPPPPAWQYGYGHFNAATATLESFTAFPHFEKDSWQGGMAWPDPRLGWLRLTAEGGHPGEGPGHAVVRRWISPIDGEVHVSGELSHPAAQGDGIRGTLLHSAKGQLASWLVHNQKAETSISRIPMRRGEWLDFIVDFRESISHDDFLWAPVIKLAAGNTESSPARPGGRWDARKDFAGPPWALPQPLDPWSALAQALLMSNEFVFVD